MSTPPPRFFSLGMPPANRPPSCGAADSMPPAAAGAPLSLLPWSLLLRMRLPPGTGGASPGTGGAPPIGGAPPPPEDFVTCGAERSFVTAFLSARPFWISPSNAPCVWYNHQLLGLSPSLLGWAIITYSSCACRSSG